MTRNASALMSIFSGRNRANHRMIPSHLLEDCGFEGAANTAKKNFEIECLTLRLSSLR